MPRIVSNPHENNSRHSGYHTNLLSNSHGVLERIATNTENINVNVGDVEINAQELETLTTATNAKLDAQKSVLDAMLIDTDAIDSSLNTIEAQSVLTASRLNNIQNSITADGAGGGNKLGVINTSILAKNTEIETSMNSLISANHTDLVALESSLTSMESKQDSILSKNTENEALLTSIKTAVELLDNTVAGSELQVDIVSAPTLTVSGTVTSNLSATDNAVLDDMASKLDSIKTAVQLIDNTVSGSELQVDIVAAPTLTVSGTVTSNLSATDNAVLDDMASKLDSIKTAVQLIDNTVAGTELQVDVVAALPAGTNKLGLVALKANEAADGSGTERHLLCDSAGHLQVDVISSSSTTVNGTVTANLSATDNAVLDDMASKLNSIKTAVEILDNAISGNEMQCDIVAPLPAGTNKLGLVALKANEAADGSGTERHLLCDSAGHLQIDVISAPTTTVSGTITANLSATDNSVLDAIATDGDNIQTLITSTNQKIDTFDAVLDASLLKQTNIETLLTTQNTKTVGSFTLGGGGSVTGGGGTLTSSSIELKQNNSVTIVVTTNGSLFNFVPSFEGSFDNSSFFTINSSVYSSNSFDDGSTKKFITIKDFNVKFLKLKITNNHSGANVFTGDFCY